MRRDLGFTIVELLIVIVVIGILAAITLVAFGGIQDRANNTTVRSDLSAVAKKLEIYKVDTGTYPPMTLTELTKAELEATKSAYITGRNNFYYCTNADRSQYAVAAVSKANQGFMMTNGTVSEVGSGSAWGAQTCTAAGNDGGSALGGYNHNSTANTGSWASWVRE